MSSMYGIGCFRTEKKSFALVSGPSAFPEDRYQFARASYVRRAIIVTLHMASTVSFVYLFRSYQMRQL